MQTRSSQEGSEWNQRVNEEKSLGGLWCRERAKGVKHWSLNFHLRKGHKEKV
jgi:hypothetical protein